MNRVNLNTFVAVHFILSTLVYGPAALFEGYNLLVNLFFFLVELGTAIRLFRGTRYNVALILLLSVVLRVRDFTYYFVWREKIWELRRAGTELTHLLH